MSPSSSQTRWYVANTQAGAEDGVEQHVMRQGFRCFVPRQVWIVRHGGRQHEKHSPFFPGCLFVSFDAMRDNWRSLDAAIGIPSLFMRNDLPLCCPQGLVEHFLDLAGEDGVLNFQPSFTGRRAHVMHGPFASLSSRLLKHGSTSRVQILLEIMGADAKVAMAMRNPAPGAVEAARQWDR